MSNSLLWRFQMEISTESLKHTDWDLIYFLSDFMFYIVHYSVIWQSNPSLHPLVPTRISMDSHMSPGTDHHHSDSSPCTIPPASLHFAWLSPATAMLYVFCERRRCSLMCYEYGIQCLWIYEYGSLSDFSCIFCVCFDCWYSFTY